MSTRAPFGGALRGVGWGDRRSRGAAAGGCVRIAGERGTECATEAAVGASGLVLERVP